MTEEEQIVAEAYSAAGLIVGSHLRRDVIGLIRSGKAREDAIDAIVERDDPALALSRGYAAKLIDLATESLTATQE